MKKLARLAFLSFFMLTILSCASVTPSYSSSAPEERGERAILSKIKLEGEVNLVSDYLGIFSSTEQYTGGIRENVLFVLKGKNVGFLDKGISNYSFDNVGSITLDQARQLITALNDYLKKETTEYDINQLYNFELITGVIDNKSTSELKTFQKITFIINYSITNLGKTFRTIFWGAQGNQYFELEDEQVLELTNIIETVINSKTTNEKIGNGDA